jgi:hypothetical protein
MNSYSLTDCKHAFTNLETEKSTVRSRFGTPGLAIRFRRLGFRKRLHLAVRHLRQCSAHEHCAGVRPQATRPYQEDNILA